MTGSDFLALSAIIYYAELKGYSAQIAMAWKDFINQPIPSLLNKGKTKDWYSLFNDIAYQKFWDETESQRAADMALEAISADNFAKLGPFDAANNPESYLRVVYTRAVIDAHQIIYGKCQPLKVIKDLGQKYVDVFRELCCRKKDHDTISHKHADDDYPKKVITEMITMVKRLDKSCGREVGPAPAPSNEFDDGQSEDFFSRQASQSHLASFEGKHYEAVLAALTVLLDPKAYQEQHAALDAIGQKLAEQHVNLVSQISFLAEERLILKTHFLQHKSITDIANMHHMKYHDVRKHLKNALAKAKNVFESADLGFNDFQMPD